MASQDKIVKNLKRLVYGKKILPEKARANYETFFTDKTLPNSVDLQAIDEGGQEVFVFKPIITNPVNCVLYFHGGFFTFGSQATYSSFCASLANVCQARVFLPKIEYSSEKQFPFQLEELYRLTLNLLGDLPPNARLCFAGDGSGAGLALALTLYLKERQKPLPIGLALISPFADQQIKKQKTKDPLLNAELLQNFASMYIGHESAENKLISPLRAEPSSFANWPTTFIQACREEFLFEQSTKLQELIIAEGGSCKLESFSDLWHFFHIFPDSCDKSHIAVESFGKHILEIFSPPKE